MTIGVALVLGVAIGALLMGLAHVGRARAGSATSASSASRESGQDPSGPALGETLHGAIDALPIGVVLISAGGEVVDRNRSAVVDGGRHRQVLVEEALEQMSSEVLGTGAPVQRRLRLAGAVPTSLVVSVHPLATGGAIATLEDVTERERIDAVRTDFVANLSHELKTPVGALAVLAETISASVHDGDPEVLDRLAERMVGEAHRVSTTIDELLELSRIELDGRERREVVDASAVVGDAIARVQSLADRRRIALRTRIPDDPVTLWGERRQLVSALGNLLENAVKYSEADGEVDVEVLDGEDVVAFQVTDRGVGIPARDLDRIFERFYRVDRARSRDTGGTGLGLSIVRHVAVHHDGTVSVHSEEGRGSVFTLTIPRVRGVADDIAVDAVGVAAGNADEFSSETSVEPTYQETG